MASKPDAPELPTPVAPPPQADIKIGSKETTSINKKKVKGIKQLQINSSAGLSTTDNVGLNT